MSKICPSCGNTLDDNQKFCSVCGQSVPSAPAQPVQTATMPTAQPQPNVCPKCGATNAPGTKFCVACGFSFAQQQPQQFQQPAYQQPQQFKQPQQFQQNPMPAPKKSKNGMIVALILIAVIVIGGAIAGIWFMTRDKDEDDDDSSSKKSSSVVSSSDEDSSEEESSIEDSSEEESSEESSEVVKPSTNENDLDEHGIFTASKFNRGYQLPIAQMMYGVQVNSYDEFINAYPECVKAYYDKKLSTDEQKKTFIDNIYKKYVSAAGEGFKINCETVSETTYSTSLAESYCKQYGGSEKVEEAYRVSFKVIVSNNGQSSSTTTSIRCFKIDGEWYVFE